MLIGNALADADDGHDTDSVVSSVASMSDVTARKQHARGGGDRGGVSPLMRRRSLRLEAQRQVRAAAPEVPCT